MRDLVSPLSGIPSPFGRKADRYKVLGFRPPLVLDFDDDRYRVSGANTSFSNAITHTRASTATYVDADGILQTAASGVPRIGHHVYNGSAWVNEGLLHESEARTNLVLQSEQFDTTWSSDNLSSLVDDGDYWTLTTNSTSAAHGVSQTATLSGTTFCAWAIVSYDNAKWLRLQLGAAPNNDEIQQLFDIQNGTKGTTVSVGANVTSYETDIKNIGPSTYLVYVSGTYSSSKASLPFFVRIQDDDNPNPHGTSGLKLRLHKCQLEAGLTPSSYIKTEAATATRAAETLTIPAANLPWPTPVVIGPELVTNGTFDTDVSGWTNNGMATFEVQSGRLRITANSNTDSVYQDVTTTSGKVYLLTFDYEQVGGDSLFDGNGVQWVSGSITGTGSISHVFVGTGSDRVEFAEGGVGNNADFYLDNISVREINPLAVSIQMDGTINYADEGIAAQQTFLRWQLDANNYISVDLDTDSTATGEVNFNQAASGTVDTVATAGNALSPSIATTFNIASRHGSTFINGAIDGTALTADTTPVALAALSASDLNLGFDYNGTIKTVRIWANDVTDPGLEAATT